MSKEIKDSVEHIVKTLEHGFEGFMKDNEYGETQTAFDYLSDVLDIEYIVNVIVSRHDTDLYIVRTQKLDKIVFKLVIATKPHNPIMRNVCKKLMLWLRVIVPINCLCHLVPVNLIHMHVETRFMCH